MKLTQIAVALAAVTTLSANASHAATMPFSAVFDAESTLGDMSKTFVAVPTVPDVTFSPMKSSDEEEKRSSKKAAYLLVPIGVGAALLANGFFSSDDNNRRNPTTFVEAAMPDPSPSAPPPEVAPVPELSTSVLFLCGFAVMVLMYRRRLGDFGQELSCGPISKLAV